MNVPAELMQKLTYPFHDGLQRELIRVRFVTRAGKLDMVRMVDQKNRERCAVRGLSFFEKHVPAIRELYQWLKQNGVPVSFSQLPS